MSNTSEVMEETEKRVAEYNVTDAAIAELSQRSEETVAAMANVDIGTGAEYEMVKAVEAPIRKLRVQVEGKRKELKADALAWGRLVDTEAKRITAALKKAEDPAKALRLKWDAEKERIKAEREAAIKAHSDYIVSALNWLKSQSPTWFGLSAGQLQDKQIEYMEIEIDGRWEEFESQAAVAHAELLACIDVAITSAIEAEEVAAAQKAEAERLAQDRAKLEAEQHAAAKQRAADQAEAEKQRREAQALVDAQQKEIDDARAKLEAEQAEAKAAIEKANAEFEAKRAAEQAEKDRIERERQIRQQAEADAKAALERAAAEKQEQEKQAELDQAREEELRPDKEKLAAYIVAIAAASGEKPNLEHNYSSIILAGWELELCSMLTDWKTNLEAGQ